MTMPTAEWNYDRIVSAKSQILSVENDMMTIVHRGYATKGMRDRMVALLRAAADDLEMMKVAKEISVPTK